MSFTLRLSLCFLALSLSLFNPRLTQSQSVPNPSTSSEINDLAASLVIAVSEGEQERLLARKPLERRGRGDRADLGVVCGRRAGDGGQPVGSGIGQHARSDARFSSAPASAAGLGQTDEGRMLEASGHKVDEES
jgi:hypothetical protein